MVCIQSTCGLGFLFWVQNMESSYFSHAHLKDLFSSPSILEKYILFDWEVKR